MCRSAASSIGRSYNRAVRLLNPETRFQDASSDGSVQGAPGTEHVALLQLIAGNSVTSKRAASAGRSATICHTSFLIAIFPLTAMAVGAQHKPLAHSSQSQRCLQVSPPIAIICRELQGTKESIQQQRDQGWSCSCEPRAVAARNTSSILQWNSRNGSVIPILFILLNVLLRAKQICWPCDVLLASKRLAVHKIRSLQCDAGKHFAQIFT